MREGYLMHRLSVRLFGDAWPRVCTSTDGAELGKAMVADGAGPTLLPAFSVQGDPLERAGVIVHRPVTGLDTTVSLALRMRRTPGSRRRCDTCGTPWWRVPRPSAGPRPDGSEPNGGHHVVPP